MVPGLSTSNLDIQLCAQGTPLTHPASARSRRLRAFCRADEFFAAAASWLVCFFRLDITGPGEVGGQPREEQ